MGKISKLIIHCSDSEFGNAFMIDRWHKDRGWDGIGYHRVILNGYPEDTKNYWSHLDGAIETGRPLNTDPWIDAAERGAHAYGYNSCSVGICFIGKPEIISPRQLAALKAVVLEFMLEFGIYRTPEAIARAVLGHHDVDPRKWCPGIDMPTFRDYLLNPAYEKQLCKPWQLLRRANNGGIDT